MTWVQIEDDFPDHPKIVRVGVDAAFLHLAAICYCGRLTTDGKFPRAQVCKLATIRNVKGAVTKLLDVGLWEDADEDHYRIHDYLKHQRSKAQIDTERSAARERMKRSRS